ncbi:hypothetical protein [Trujillonella humicola]|uniref:hypothetical protein n=1 Tax=Trujillonella humicola TaxID=3383699 RepID=UPI0039057CDB
MEGTADAVLAMDGLGLVATAGFFVPAAVLVAVVVGAVVRDRRLTVRENARLDGSHERLDPGPDRPGPARD